MKTLRALAWKESRQVAPEAAMLLGVAIVGPQLASLAAYLGGTWSPDIPSLVLGLIVLPIVGLMLGATFAAGDGAWVFLRSRPVSPTITAVVRLAVRAAAALAIVAVAGGVVFAMGGSRAVEDQPSMITAITWLACWFVGAAIASCFVRRPLKAVAVGVAVSALMLLACGAAIGFENRADDGGVLVVAVGVFALLVPVLLAAGAKTDEAPVRLSVLARPAALAALVLGALAAGWLVIGNLVAKHALREAEQSWTRAGLPLEDPAKLPAVPRNESALALETIANRLDIHVADRDSRSKPIGELHGHAIADHVARVSSDPRSQGPVVPAEVTDWLAVHAADVAALREVLTSRDAPRWRSQPSAVGAAPLPSLTGHVRLHKLLLADAARAERDALHDIAVQDVDAAWALEDGLAPRPELISQLIRIAEARLRCGVMRKLASTPDGWTARLEADRGDERVLTALRGETALFMRHADMFLSGVGAWGQDWDETGPLDVVVRMRRVFVTPAQRIEVGRFIGRLAEPLDALRKLPTCGPGSVLDGAGDRLPWPTASKLSWVTERSLVATWSRVGRLDAQVDLTQAVLALRRARASDPTGRWPDRLPDTPHHCTVAPSYRVEADGTAVISLDAGNWRPDDAQDNGPLLWVDGPSADAIAERAAADRQSR